MQQRENQGYIITDSFHAGEVEFVLGTSKTVPSQYVTWKCKNQDYYWGHYFNDLFAAQKDFIARAQDEILRLEELRMSGKVLDNQKEKGRER